MICEKHYVQYNNTNEHIVDIGYPNISDYKSYDYNKYSKSIRVSGDIQSKLDMLKRAGKIKKLLNTDTDGK